MVKSLVLVLFIFFFGTTISAQTKDSISFYKTNHDVPVKYKLAHFSLRGKVKSFYEATLPENGDIEKVIHEFDVNGNLIQVTNSFGQVIKKYNYVANGALISYTTISKSMRNFEVKLNNDGNVTQLIINNKDHGISTVANEYNKNGLWTKQIRLEDQNILQEYVYENDTKLAEFRVYADNKIAESTQFSYVFFPEFVQIKLTSTYQDAAEKGVNYIYADYFGNEILGFPADEGHLSEQQIKDVLQNFKVDENNNWVKNQEVIRVISYY